MIEWSFTDCPLGILDPWWDPPPPPLRKLLFWNHRSILSKLGNNSPWSELYEIGIIGVDQKAKMAATTGHKPFSQKLQKQNYALFKIWVFVANQNSDMSAIVEHSLNFWRKIKSSSLKQSLHEC